MKTKIDVAINDTNVDLRKIAAIISGKEDK